MTTTAAADGPLVEPLRPLLVPGTLVPGDGHAGVRRAGAVPELSALPPWPGAS